MGTTSYNSNNEHTVNYVQCQQAPLWWCKCNSFLTYEHRHPHKHNFLKDFNTHSGSRRTRSTLRKTLHVCKRMLALGLEFPKCTKISSTPEMGFTPGCSARTQRFNKVCHLQLCQSCNELRGGGYVLAQVLHLQQNMTDNQNKTVEARWNSTGEKEKETSHYRVAKETFREKDAGKGAWNNHEQALSQ